jgi:hypothetical protein
MLRAIEFPPSKIRNLTRGQSRYRGLKTRVKPNEAKWLSLRVANSVTHDGAT